MKLPNLTMVAVVTVSVTAVVAEIVARLIFGLQPLVYGYPYHPIFVSGDYYYLASNDELARGPGGPTALGYEADVLSYRYPVAALPPRNSTDLSNFLFRHNRSQYDSNAVDDLACGKPDATVVYVVGGSVAQGFSASSKATTWHAVLEGMLRKEMRNQELYVANAAMGGFVSFQEKLAYYLAVVPRDGRVVLIVDSYNDLLAPASSGTRPGDPHHLAVRFSQFFGNGFVWWLAKQSAIVNAILRMEIEGNIAANRRQLDENDEIFLRYANAATDIYLENTTEMLSDCEAHGRACLVGLQPSRSLTASHIGVKADDVISQRRVRQLYEILMGKVAKSLYRARFVDLTASFDSPERFAYFTDAVHPDDRGQKLLAEALLPRVAEAVKARVRRNSPTEHCNRWEGR